MGVLRIYALSDFEVPVLAECHMTMAAANYY
jgi:hypothetical protein